MMVHLHLLNDTSMTVTSGALVVGDIITFGTDTDKYKISEITLMISHLHW